MEKLFYTIKIGSLYLYHNGNMFTPRVGKCRLYKTKTKAEEWISSSEYKLGISEAGILAEDLYIVEISKNDDGENQEVVYLW